MLFDFTVSPSWYEQPLPPYPCLMRYEGSTSDVSLHFYRILSTTRCGVWIESASPQRKRFVNQTANRQWAWPTKQAARESFALRKRYQLQILAHQHDDVKAIIARIEKEWPNV